VDNSIICIVKEERNILHTLKGRKAKWTGHILSRNCLLKHVIEGKTERTGRRIRRRKQLLDVFKETGIYSSSKRKH
jgi:TolB-like protein